MTNSNVTLSNPTEDQRTSMTVERGLRLVAGTFVLLSVALGVTVSPWFLAFTAFVGANLLQSGLTDWCPMMTILSKTGLR